MKKTLFALVVFCLVATNTFAQKKVKGEGSVKYKMKIEGMGEDPSMAALMGDVMIDMHMSGRDTRVNVNVMGGMVKVGYIEKEGEKPITLMDMMGQKMKFDPGNEQNPPIQALNMTYVANKRKTKKIAGYKCHEVKAMGEDGSEIILYVTKKIKLTPPNIWMLSFIDFGKFTGYPLECFIEGEGQSFTFTAQEVKGKLAKETFEYDPSEYQEMSEEGLEGMGMDKGIIGL